MIRRLHALAPAILTSGAAMLVSLTAMAQAVKVDYVTQHDIANMALFVCSPFGATISGQALSVDGDQQRLG